MRKFSAVSIIVVLICLACLVGCSNRQQSQGTMTKLTVGIEQDIKGMESFDLGGLCYLMYEPLVNLKYENGNIEKIPGLAENWKHNDNCTEWTFQLRKGVKFHDGTEFDAEDVKFTFNRALAGKILAFSTIRSIAKIECSDQSTVVFYLKAPGYTFPSDTALIGIESSTTQLDEKENVIKPIGTGPFVFKERVKGQKVDLQRFDDYWQGKAKAEEITFKIIPDAQTRMMAVKAGEIDTMYGWGILSLIPTMKGDPNINVLSIEDQGQTAMYVNANMELFKDKNIRLAIACAMNREEICNQLNELSEPNYHLFGPRFKKYINLEAKAPQTNVDQAKQLLAASGWADTNGNGIFDKNGEEFRVKLSYCMSFSDHAKAAEVIQKQLRNIGIDVQLVPLERGAFDQGLKGGKYDLALYMQTYIPHDEPCNYYTGYFFSKNPMSYKIFITPELDQSIGKLMMGVDESERLKSHYEIQKKIMETGAIVPIYSSKVTFAVQKKVKGFNCPPSYCPLWEWSQLKDVGIEQ